LSFGSIAPQILELRGVENRIFPIQVPSLIQQCYATACTVIARIFDRNSGRLDGRTSVTRVHCTKTVEARIMKLTPQGSPMTSFPMPNLAAKFEGEHRERGRQIRKGYENTQFSANKSPYLGHGAREDHSYY